MAIAVQEATILAIECAGSALSIAIVRHDRVHTLHEGSTAQHGQCLLPLIQQACQAQHLALKNIDLIAVGIGPGSFTGVRTAITAAQGLALALGKSVVGVDSLQALAWQAQACGVTGVVVSLLDARMGEIYGAVYRCTAPTYSPQLLMTPSVQKPQAAQQWLNHNPIVCIGNVLVQEDDFLKDVQQIQAVPSAAAIGALGRLALIAGETVLPENLHPMYVRNHVAMTISERAALGHTI